MGDSNGPPYGDSGGGAGVRYECSSAAEDTWGSLLTIFARHRLGDAQSAGFNWAERALSMSANTWSDLGTDARLTYVAAQDGLDALECEQRAAVVLARRKLGLQRITDVLRRFRLTREVADELIEGVKEYLHYMVSEEPETPPELPWQADNAKGADYDVRQIGYDKLDNDSDRRIINLRY